MADEGQVLNTDRELWREREGDYYANSIHVTEGGGIGMNVGGLVIVLPIHEWHKLARKNMEHSGAQVESPSAPSPELSPSEKRELWLRAACGRHATRYGEEDNVWDATCKYCAANFHVQKELTSLRAEVEKMRKALSKINDLRNDIIGRQTVGFSAHVYPLVAILEEAGYKGLGYEEARDKVQTAESRNGELEAALRKLREAVLELEGTPIEYRIAKRLSAAQLAAAALLRGAK